MQGSRSSSSKPYTIVLSGFVGSGKSTLGAALSKGLGKAPVLIFDHYEQFIEWPQDMDRWMKAGADPVRIRVPKLKADLLALIQGVDTESKYIHISILIQLFYG
jgi:uridine kinase